MYAIVDIETTGSYAANNGITELAIVLHDGNKIVDRFETLVNPQIPVPAIFHSQCHSRPSERKSFWVHTETRFDPQNE